MDSAIVYNGGDYRADYFFFDCAAYRFLDDDSLTIVYNPLDIALPDDLLGYGALRWNEGRAPRRCAIGGEKWLDEALGAYQLMKELAADMTGKALILIDFKNGLCSVQLRELHYLGFTAPEEWKRFASVLSGANTVELMNGGKDSFWLEARFYAE